MARKKVSVSLSSRAKRDLLEIYRYLFEQSSQTLKIVDKKIFKSLRLLESSPRSGHWVKELSGKKYREILVFHYRVIYLYRPKERKVQVMTIRHGKRFFPKALI